MKGTGTVYLWGKIFDLLKTSTQKHAFTEPINLVNKGDGEVALLKQIPSFKD